MPKNTSEIDLELVHSISTQRLLSWWGTFCIMGEMLAHLKLTHDLDIYIKFIGFITPRRNKIFSFIK